MYNYYSSSVIQELLSTHACLDHRIPTSDLQGYLYGFGNERVINSEKNNYLFRLRIVIRWHLSFVQKGIFFGKYQEIMQNIMRLFNKRQENPNQSGINHEWMGGRFTNGNR